MTVDQDELLAFNDSQKTVYMLKRKQGVIKDQDDKIPMIDLLEGNEDPAYIETRMVMFQKFWSSKQDKIKSILHGKNDHLFQQVVTYLQEPNTDHVFKSVMLLMGANLSSHNLMLSNLKEYLHGYDNLKIVNLNSKDCHSLKAALVSLIRQVIWTLTNDLELDEDPDDEEAYVGNFLKYDFDAVVDWFNNNGSTHVVVIFEDSELFDTQCLTSLMGIIRSSSVGKNFKLIFGISSSIELFAENLSTSVMDAIDGHVVNLSDPSETLREITDKILFELEVENSSDFLLLLGPTLLSELAKYKHNELLFIDVLKYAYSIYFYNNPLCLLNLVSIDEDSEDEFEIDSKLIDSLRRTQSFKRQIEKFNVMNANKEILEFFNDDLKLARDFKYHYRNFYRMGEFFYKLLDLFINLQLNFNNGKIINSKFQIYSMIIQQDSTFYQSSFYQELLNLIVKNVDIENLDNFLQDINDTTFITQDQINEELGNKLIDDITPQSLKIICKKLSELIDLQIKNFFKEFNEILYKEVFTIDITLPNHSTDDNIIASSFNPFIRSSNEAALNNPNSYLFMARESHSLYDDLAQLIEPTLCELFTLYRELNILVNIHDFFIAFKESIQREKLVDSMVTILQDKKLDPDLQILLNDLTHLNKLELTKQEETTWEKITLSWFLQLMAELQFIGFIKDLKKKADAVEKLVWKGI